MTPLVGISPEAALDCSWRDGLHDGPLVEVAPGETVVVVPRVDLRVILLDLFVLPDSAAHFDIMDVRAKHFRLLTSVVPSAAFDLTRAERMRDPFGQHVCLPATRLEVHVRNVSEAPRKFRAYFKVVERGGY